MLEQQRAQPVAIATAAEFNAKYKGWKNHDSTWHKDPTFIREWDLRTSSLGQACAPVIPKERLPDDERRRVPPKPDWASTDPHRNAWPEASEALEAMMKWAEDEGICPPRDDSDEHRPQVNIDSPHLGFGCIVRPIAPSSAEWKGKTGQSALMKEMMNHQDRGT